MWLIYFNNFLFFSMLKLQLLLDALEQRSQWWPLQNSFLPLFALFRCKFLIFDLWTVVVGPFNFTLRCYGAPYVRPYVSSSLKCFWLEFYDFSLNNEQMHKKFKFSIFRKKTPDFAILAKKRFKIGLSGPICPEWLFFAILCKITHWNFLIIWTKFSLWIW